MTQINAIIVDDEANNRENLRLLILILFLLLLTINMLFERLNSAPLIIY